MSPTQRSLGSGGPKVTAMGLGCMGLSEFYGPPTDLAEAKRFLHQAIDLGVDHFDTAESYGLDSANERLLGEAFEGRRQGLVIATKFGPLRDAKTGAITGLDGSRKNCRRAVEASLERLKTDWIDLYYLHRVDPNTPIEVTVTAMAELVQEGKIRGIGLSEASAETIARAAKVHPIAAVQSEYSIFSRDIEGEVLPACVEAGASLVAYSPLGRGMLTGSFAAGDTLAKADFRGSMQPRFEGEAYAANLALVEQIRGIASAHAVLPAQVALAWVMARSEIALPIPGTTRLENLQTNLAAMDLALDPGELTQLDALADRVQGERYNAFGMALLNG